MTQSLPDPASPFEHDSRGKGDGAQGAQQEFCHPHLNLFRSLPHFPDRSQTELVSRISIVVEEAGESLFWLELLDRYRSRSSLANTGSC